MSIYCLSQGTMQKVDKVVNLQCKGKKKSNHLHRTAKNSSNHVFQECNDEKGPQS